MARPHMEGTSTCGLIFFFYIKMYRLQFFGGVGVVFFRDIRFFFGGVRVVIDIFLFTVT